MATMTNLQLIETSDCLKLVLHNWHVNRCIVDYSFTLKLMTNHEEGIGVSIHAVFSIDKDNERLNFNPEHPEGLGPALSLFRSQVKEILAGKDGSLKIVSSEATLTVPNSNQYEPWGLYGPDGLRIVSIPGGDLAMWDFKSSS